MAKTLSAALIVALTLGLTAHSVAADGVSWCYVGVSGRDIRAQKVPDGTLGCYVTEAPMDMKYYSFYRDSTSADCSGNGTECCFEDLCNAPMETHTGPERLCYFGTYQPNNDAGLQWQVLSNMSNLNYTYDACVGYLQECNTTRLFASARSNQTCQDFGLKEGELVWTGSVFTKSMCPALKSSLMAVAPYVKDVVCCDQDYCNKPVDFPLGPGASQMKSFADAHNVTTQAPETKVSRCIFGLVSSAVSDLRSQMTPPGTTGCYSMTADNGQTYYASYSGMSGVNCNANGIKCCDRDNCNMPTEQQSGPNKLCFTGMYAVGTNDTSSLSWSVLSNMSSYNLTFDACLSAVEFCNGEPLMFSPNMTCADLGLSRGSLVWVGQAVPRSVCTGTQAYLSFSPVPALASFSCCYDNYCNKPENLVLNVNTDTVASVVNDIVNKTGGFLPPQIPKNITGLASSAVFLEKPFITIAAAMVLSALTL